MPYLLPSQTLRMEVGDANSRNRHGSVPSQTSPPCQTASTQDQCAWGREAVPDAGSGKSGCVLPTSHPPCQQCDLRGITCIAQQPAIQDVVPSGGLSSLEEERLKQRLADIEIDVRDIWAKLILTGASPSPTGLLPRAPAATATVEDHVGVELESMLDVENATHATTLHESDVADDGFGFQDAPLLTLIKTAGMREELQSASSASSAPSAGRLKASGAVHLPEHPMLQDDDLLMVLAATEPYWSIWPPWEYSTLPSTTPTLETGGVVFAARFLSSMARSSSPCIAAKAWLWLSLCVQQAPKTLQLSQSSLSHEALLTSYMQTADSLLTSATGRSETLDGIEARLIQQMLYINMGWPRQAWLSVRRAADSALLLGLHRTPDQKEGGGREVAIWTTIWRLKTTFALILGRPGTIPIPTGSSGCDSPLHTLQHKMCSLAASVVARNQSAQPSYLTTVQIGHELDGYRTLMPDSWWNEPPQPERPFAQLYAQQATKIQYFLIVKLLHLPFMLSGNAEYEYSYTSAVAASRGLIAAYVGLRSCSRGLSVVCEGLEFQAFRAGITLLIRLLSPTSAGRPGHDADSEDDWQLIEALTMVLQRTASLMRCSVASQAAEVLGLLTQAAPGAYAGPDRYDVVLPYFGKISIALSRGRKPEEPQGWEESCQQQQQVDLALPSFGTVEFSANPFNFLRFLGSLQGELGGDWSSIPDVDVGFDWNQTFTFDNNNNNHLP